MAAGPDEHLLHVNTKDHHHHHHIESDAGTEKVRICIKRDYSTNNELKYPYVVVVFCLWFCVMSCHVMPCQRYFGGDTSKSGKRRNSFGKGHFKALLYDWSSFLRYELLGCGEGPLPSTSSSNNSTSSSATTVASGSGILTLDKEDSFRVIGVQIGHLGRVAQFYALTLGIFTFLLVYGFLQEYIVIHVSI